MDAVGVSPLRVQIAAVTVSITVRSFRLNFQGPYRGAAVRPDQIFREKLNITKIKNYKRLLWGQTLKAEMRLNTRHQVSGGRLTYPGPRRVHVFYGTHMHFSNILLLFVKKDGDLM
jgi:hypothetical protein